MTEKNGEIYKLTFPNGKVYIGLTTRGVKARFNQHCSEAQSRKSNLIVHKAIRKYGRDNVEVSVIATGTASELVDLERESIARYNSVVPNGYNSYPAGSNPVAKKWNKEAMSERMKQLWADSDFRERFANGIRNRVLSPEQQKLKDECAQKRAYKEANKNRIHSPEHKANCSRIQKEVNRRPEVIERKLAARAKQNTPEYAEKMRVISSKIAIEKYGLERCLEVRAYKDMLANRSEEEKRIAKVKRADRLIEYQLNRSYERAQQIKEKQKSLFDFEVPVAREPAPHFWGLGFTRKIYD